MLGVIRVFLVGLLNNTAVRSLAWKYFLKAVVMSVIPLAIMAGLNMFVSNIIDWSVAKIDATSPGNLPSSSLPALACYLYAQCGLDVGVPAVVGAFATKFMFKCIPFLRI